MYFYRYYVQFYDETKKNGSMADAEGITFGCDYNEALEHLCHYYGEGNISMVSMELIVTDDDDVVQDICEMSWIEGMKGVKKSGKRSRE